MKRTVKTILYVLVVILSLTMVLSSCNLARKLQGVELKFQQKIKNATQLSFDMFLTIQDKDGTSSLDISCYKKGNEYAYTFAQPGTDKIVYRRLFADEKLYEYLTNTTGLVATGTYYVNDNVPYIDEKNILYSVSQNIMLASYATLLTTGKKDTVNGVETYRYDFDHEGNQYSLWFDDENLFKVVAVFNKTDENGQTTSEIYSVLFSNYHFDSVPAEPFLRPNETTDAIYVNSVIPFETWMEIINKFSVRADKWL